MIIIKTPKEIEIMREGGMILAKVLKKVAEHVRVGITTQELDKLAKEFVFEYQAKPSFEGYKGYPAGLCTSVNEEIVHGIPSKRKLKSGDIIGLDLGVLYKGYYTDAAITVPVGKVSSKVLRLIKVTKKALEVGIEKVRVGNHIGDIGAAIGQYVEAQGFNVVRNLVGHGVGKHVHEEPQIPNYGRPGTGPEIKVGMTLALEPMVVMGGWQTEQAQDGWAFITKDKSYSAHFEHTVAVTEKAPRILTNP